MRWTLPTRTPRTKYQPLLDFLAVQTEREVTLSLAEIEAIIGVPLSVTASITPQVWHSTAEAQVCRWREMGWSARYDRRNRCVHFARDTEE